MESRISRNSKVMSGRYCVRGTRIPVTQIKQMVADGISLEEICQQFYNGITIEDVKACIKWRNPRYKLDSLEGNK